MKYSELPAWLKKVTSAHRGYGTRQNSLKAIREAIDMGFPMVELDVQFHAGEFVLGHPPYMWDETLEEALACFKDTDALPKIDVKIASSNINKDFMSQLVANLSTLEGVHKLVILSHFPDYLEPSEYMRAEKLLYQECKRTKQGDIFLNIDLLRYHDISNPVIITHLRSLKPMIYSISPEMKDSSMDETYRIARAAEIYRLQFWLHEGKGHKTNIKELESVYHDAAGQGFWTSFDLDIKRQIISSH